MTTGFKIKKDGTRVPEEYSSDHGRTWFECKELVHHGHYEEAHEKLDEYWEYCTRPDWKLVLEVETGFLKIKPSEEGFKNLVGVWGKALVEDSGVDIDDYLGKANEIISMYKDSNKIKVSSDDFAEATVNQTTKLLDFLCLFLEFGDDIAIDLEEIKFLDAAVYGIRHLTDKGEMTKAKQFCAKVSNLGCGTYKSYIKERKDWIMGVEEA